MSLTGRHWRLMALIWKVMETLEVEPDWQTSVTEACSGKMYLWNDFSLHSGCSELRSLWHVPPIYTIPFVSGPKQRIQLTCFKISGSTSWYEIFLFLNSFRYLHYFHIHSYVYHFTDSLLSLQFVYRNI